MKFRGFCRNENGKETIYLNGEAVKGRWLQGYCYKDPLYNTHIITKNGASNKVIPETICEAVRERSDKNGKQVFEWDYGRLHYGEKTNGEAVYAYGYILFDEEKSMWVLRAKEGDHSISKKSWELEVIGTKWDKNV